MRAIGLSLVFTSAVAIAQTPAGPPRFEVVSIKRNTSNALGSNGSSERPDGGFTLLNVPMMTLVARAQFPLIAPVDMVGLPEWARSERYDVIAASPLSRPATPQERAAMVRAMLADRVRLATHVEKRQLPVYDLVLARADGRLGAGIRPSEVDCEAKAAADRSAAEAGSTPPPRPAPDFGSPPASCNGLRITGALIEGDVTMENLARFLRGSAGRPVIDKTGLKGSYRVKVQYDRALGGGPDVTPSSGTAPSVFSALPAQLGLKLEASKAEQEVLVIDRLERPTEN
jgi:uncharacterized protein (TIGR03435 family)